ncbi:hypothetical protein GGD67_002682 [Bradyrhizobium sp. IAR9]|nr:hypothetical protein [Bradyrhizobium sp. IAR9]
MSIPADVAFRRASRPFPAIGRCITREVSSNAENLRCRDLTTLRAQQPCRTDRGQGELGELPMSVSQVCSEANTAALACAFVSFGRFGTIATAGARVVHAGTAMLGLQMHKRAARTLSFVRDCRALACVRETLSRVPPRRRSAAGRHLSDDDGCADMGRLPTTSCVSFRPFRIHAKAAASGFRRISWSAWHAQVLPRMDERQ